MSTLREQAQFIDELRQHYRRLDGLLVWHRDKLHPNIVWEFNAPVLALRRLLFGGVGDPNAASSTPPHATPPQAADQKAAPAASPVKLEVVR